jgi:hypothetical protein
MIRTRLIVFTGTAVLFAAACDRTEPTAPRVSAARIAWSQSGASCAIDVGETTNPLPALHELEGWLGDAVDAVGSSLTCGQVLSLDAKMEALTKALDQSPPNFAAACGISGALVNELSALVSGGQLATPSFPPPFPGGPTTVLAAAAGLNERWCAAKRGELVGPPGR